MNIPYLDLKPQYKALEKQINDRIQTVLNHGLFILGPEVEECEKALAAYVGAKHCLTISNGTDALMVPLMAMGIGPGDEVITTAFSFFATAEVISLVGATPVFVDIDPVTYNMDPSKIEAAITKKTKAIIPVALYGQPADMEEINAIAAKHGLKVLEDSAQSFGAPYKNSKSCNISYVAGTSFFPAKPLGCYGDGGAIFTNDSELNRIMSQIRVHGQEGRYNHVRMGVNGRLDTIQCAIVIEKLKRYDWEIKQRQAVATRYNSAFEDLGERCVIPRVKSDRSSVWAQYTVMVKDRAEFAKKLQAKGVPTSVHYPSPLHKQPVYSHLSSLYNLPVSEKVAAHVISLPLYPDMPVEHQEAVIKAVRESV